MRFGTFLLRIGGTRDAELDDLKRVCDIGPKTFQPDGQKNLYVIDTCIIDERFFWLACDYDDAVSFRDYVVNQDTGELVNILTAGNRQSGVLETSGPAIWKPEFR